MTKHQPLPFLRGTFAWSFLGYFFAERPPMNLLAPEVLASDNPWIVLAAVLEHAKRGDHSYVARLRKWFHSGGEGCPDRAYIHLTGDAGREADLQALPPLMEQGPDPLRAYAAEAAVMAGRLWLVRPMLEAWKRVSSLAHHETIGYALSSLLEAPGGPIAINAGSYNLPPDAIAHLKNPALRALAERRAAEEPVTEFELQVGSRFDELRGQLGAGAAVWRGQLFSVPLLAEQMYDFVRDPAAGRLQGSFIPMRHRSEAATGINLSECFENGVLQPLNAAAVLETFLESEAPAQFEDGVRYFFGHRIPD